MRPIDADAAKAILNEKLDSYPEINGGGFAVGGIRKGLRIAIHTIGDAPTLHHVPRQQWISVKDRLPERGNNYLVYYSEIDEFEVIEYGYGSWITPEGDVPDYPVTHWMPLPEPPKEE